MPTIYLTVLVRVTMKTLVIIQLVT